MNKNILKLILLALAIRLILLPLVWHGDVENHVIWGIWARNYGLKGYYDFLDFFNYARPNQPPLTILLYLTVRVVYEFLYSILWWINTHVSFFPSIVMSWYYNSGFYVLLKLPGVLADLGLGYFIYKIAYKVSKKKAILAMCLFLFNPVVIYNSAVWGQTDSILMLLGILSVYFLYIRKYRLGVIFFALTLMFKATLIILFPIVFILLLRGKISIKIRLFSTFLFFATIIILCIPFTDQFSVGWFVDLYTKKIAGGYLDFLSVNAFNFWGIFSGVKNVKDNILILGIKASTVGYVLFSLTAFVICLWLLLKINLKRLLFALVMICFAGFLLLTRMHERYLYFVFAPLTVLAVVEKKLFKIYLILSAISLVNMYNNWWVPYMGFIVNILKNDWIFRFLSIGVSGIFIWLVLAGRKLKLLR